MFLKQCYLYIPTSLTSISPVAKPMGGGCAHPHWMHSMQNTTFLALLRAIFALKGKIVPPPISIGDERVTTWPWI